MVSAERFAAALRTHGPRIVDAARAVGLTKTRVYQRADLAALAKAHTAAQRQPRNAARQLGCHGVTLPDETLARLDAYRTDMARRVGPARASRSAAVREIIRDALSGPLPEPHPPAILTYTLDLGDLWDMVGERAGTTDPRTVAGIVRAILAALPKRRNHARAGA